ncbi:transcription factor III family protein [Perkinsela sp. CCAP 1560/4]|nr:transcription factor III family protein [Perkinsela sp. CCAP 1560/4]|eukprot:KNH04772.1 transcription factor III family protein [Perkinsela sp. CCAP 1560/4]
MNQSIPEIFQGEVPSREYFQVCFPGAVGPEKGHKVLDMIGGNEGVQRAMRQCQVDGVSSLQLHLGPRTTGPTIHGTALPTTGLWLRAKVKRRRGSDDSIEKRYISDIEVKGVIRAHTVFKDPADLCCFPVSNESKFDPSALFHETNTDEATSKFVPVLKAPSGVKSAASIPSAALSMPSTQESHTTALQKLTRKRTELYLPPPLFFPETKETFTSWLQHMMTVSRKSQSGQTRQRIHTPIKMRHFELNVNSNEIQVRPKKEDYPTRTQYVNSNCLSVSQRTSTQQRTTPPPRFSTQNITIFDQQKSDGVLIIPVVPPARLMCRDERRLDKWIEVMRHLFDIRPLWSMGSLCTSVGGNVEAEANFKRVVGCVAYRVSGTTAFTKLWVRMGYNPFSHSKSTSGVEEMKAFALLQPVLFSIPRDMRRELRRKFPSFGNHSQYLYQGYHRVSRMTGDSKLRAIIKPKRVDPVPSFTQNLDKISVDSMVNIERCKQTAEELFDELLLSGSFMKKFYPQDLVHDRIHTVIKSQIPTQTDKTLGLILQHTRRTVQSILADEFGSYWRAKFQSSEMSVHDEASMTVERDDAPTGDESADQTDREISEGDILSSDSSSNISDAEDEPSTFEPST